MATQKELVEVVATQMDVALETVTVIDRLLAAAGLRTRALRGRGATSMTYKDAANLIIATALDASPKDAVRLVQEYSRLPATRVREDAEIDPEALGHNFGDALAEMIESVAASREQFSAPYDSPDHMAAEVVMSGPTPRAKIILLREGNPTTFVFEGGRNNAGDLSRSVRFSQVTLGFVGEAIADGGLK